MQLLKVIFLLVVLVAIIEAQKGGTKTRQRSPSVPNSPARKAPPTRPAPQQPLQPTKRPNPQRPIPQPQRPIPQPQRPQEPQDEEGNAGNAIEDNESIAEPPAIVPQTSFTCDDKPYQPGMYADMEVDCSVYHMCFDNRKESFLCGTGTMFNQEILSCDHPAKVNCANSPQYYDANTELGKPGAEPSSQPAPTQSGQKSGSIAPAPRPRVQKPSSKTAPPRVNQPRVNTPAPVKPFVDDTSEDEETNEEPEQPEQPEAAPARPVPPPTQPKRTKTAPPKKNPASIPAPRKQPAPRVQKTPIVQTYDSDEEDEDSNVRRSYRARY